MKVTAAAFLVLLIALAIVMILRVREIQHVKEDVGLMAPRLEEEYVEKKIMGHRQAREVIDELRDLCSDPSSLRDSLPRLREISSLAASWAAGAPAPSPELEASVNIRQAANDLRETASNSSRNLIPSARKHLIAAENALGGARDDSNVTSGIRDRVKSLEQAQREHLQELNEAY